MMHNLQRYYLKFNANGWVEVELDVWVAEERRAGFMPPAPYNKFTKATCGFSGGGEIAGKIEGPDEWND